MWNFINKSEKDCIDLRFRLEKLLSMCKKSHIRETLNLLMCANNSSNTKKILNILAKKGGGDCGGATYVLEVHQ